MGINGASANCGASSELERDGKALSSLFTDLKDGEKQEDEGGTGIIRLNSHAGREGGGEGKMRLRYGSIDKTSRCNHNGYDEENSQLLNTQVNYSPPHNHSSHYITCTSASSNVNDADHNDDSFPSNGYKHYYSLLPDLASELSCAEVEGDKRASSENFNSPPPPRLAFNSSFWQKGCGLHEDVVVVDSTTPHAVTDMQLCGTFHSTPYNTPPLRPLPKRNPYKKPRWSCLLRRYNKKLEKALIS